MLHRLHFECSNLWMTEEQQCQLHCEACTSSRERQLTLHSRYSSNPIRHSASRIRRESDFSPLCVLLLVEIAKALCFSRLLVCPHQLRLTLPSLKLVRSRHDFSNQRKHCAHPLQRTFSISSAWPMFLAAVLAASSSAVDFSSSALPRDGNDLHVSRSPVRFVLLSTNILVGQTTRHKLFSSKLCPCFVDRVQHLRNQLTSVSVQQLVK